MYFLLRFQSEANKRDMPYQFLIKSWLADGVKQTAMPGLLAATDLGLLIIYRYALWHGVPTLLLAYPNMSSRLYDAGI